MTTPPTPLLQQSTSRLYTKRVESRGNGVFATAPCAPRTQLLHIARPLLIALETAKLATHCYYCYASPQDPSIRDGIVGIGGVLKVCGGCKVVRFCGKKCQSRAWKEFHKLECKLFTRLHPRVLPTTVRALVRALKQHDAGLLPEREWDELLGLESHYDELLGAGGQRWQDVFIMMKGVKSYAGTGHSQDEILRLGCIMMVNSFTLTDVAFESLGMVLHPKSALMNHSCEPNAFVRFDVPPAADANTLPPYGGISVHALRPIKKDEEVTISYVDTSMPFAKRQEELKTRYFFECTCSLCSRGTNTSMDLFYEVRGSRIQDEAATVRLEQIGQRAERTLLNLQSKANILHTQIETIESAMKLLADTKVWPLYRYPWPQLRHELFLGLLSTANYYVGMLHSATFVRAIHPVLYEQEHHPSQLIQVYTLYDLSRQCLAHSFAAEQNSGQPTPAEFRDYIKMVGRLGCLLVSDTHKLLNKGFRMNGQLEKLVAGAYGEVSSMSMPGGAWEEYQRDPDAARRFVFSWLDNQVKEQLKREGVAQEIIELSFIRQG